MSVYPYTIELDVYNEKMLEGLRNVFGYTKISDALSSQNRYLLRKFLSGINTFPNVVYYSVEDEYDVLAIGHIFNNPSISSYLESCGFNEEIWRDIHEITNFMSIRLGYEMDGFRMVFGSTNVYSFYGQNCELNKHFVMLKYGKQKLIKKRKLGIRGQGQPKF